MRKLIYIVNLMLLLSILTSCNTNNNSQNKNNSEDKTEEHEEVEEITEENKEENIEKPVNASTKTEIPKTPFTDEEKVYLETYNKAMDTMNTNMVTISDYMVQAKENSNLYFDEEWQFNFNKYFIPMAMTNELIFTAMSDTNSVPAVFRRLHRLTGELLTQLLESRSLIIEGGQINDIETINSGIDLMENSNLKFEEISLELDRLDKIKY